MVLLAGINDVASNTGPSTAELVEQNIMAMTELAQHHGIKVILCSLLPVSDYPFLRQQKGDSPPASPRGPFPGLGPFPRLKMTETHPPSDILQLNSWLKEYAQRVNAIYADYFTALVDEKGWLKDPDSADGLHPNADGYKVMVPIAGAAVEKAFR
jgi:lysophospholipase L1-like esterase